jgi:uncharacterized metal-binding protein YceD (DUF177 family)
MTASEFSRSVDIREADGKRLTLTADDAERTALAARLGIVRVDALEADVALERDGNAVGVKGTLVAEVVQSCAVSAEDLPVSIREPLAFRFVPETGHRPDEELELDAGDLDEIEYTGTSFDLGEAVAQSLALAIDPFAVGPDAEEARRRAGLLGEAETNPFAALKGLIKE